MHSRILVIAHKFPPYFGVGSQRWEYLSKELRLLGYDLYIITVDRGQVIANENLIFYYNKDSFQVTISIGVSMVTNKENDLNVALKKADKALYQSKKSGRNKVSLFSKLTIAGK